MATYGIKWELKNYDNLSEEVKAKNDKIHFDFKGYKRRSDAQRQVNKYVALGNEDYEITVVEVEERPVSILNPRTGKYDTFMRWFEI